jgi:hypothetical protein
VVGRVADVSQTGGLLTVSSGLHLADKTTGNQKRSVVGLPDCVDFVRLRAGGF